jgi:hypothetical protein
VNVDRLEGGICESAPVLSGIPYRHYTRDLMRGRMTWRTYSSSKLLVVMRTSNQYLVLLFRPLICHSLLIDLMAIYMSAWPVVHHRLGLESSSEGVFGLTSFMR